MFSDDGKSVFSLCKCNVNKLVIGPQVNYRFRVEHPENLSIGDHTAINGDFFVDALGGVSIGKYCHIAHGLVIYSAFHDWRSTEFVPYGRNDILKPVTIEDCVWIGVRATIAPGVTLGKGSIIAMGATVFEDVPECAIVKGNPATIVGYRDKDVFYKLYSEGKCL